MKRFAESGDVAWLEGQRDSSAKVCWPSRPNPVRRGDRRRLHRTTRPTGRHLRRTTHPAGRHHLHRTTRPTGRRPDRSAWPGKVGLLERNAVFGP